MAKLKICTTCIIVIFLLIFLNLCESKSFIERLQSNNDIKKQLSNDNYVNGLIEQNQTDPLNNIIQSKIEQLNDSSSSAQNQSPLRMFSPNSKSDPLPKVDSLGTPEKVNNVIAKNTALPTDPLSENYEADKSNSENLQNNFENEMTINEANLPPESNDFSQTHLEVPKSVSEKKNSEDDTNKAVIDTSLPNDLPLDLHSVKLSEENNNEIMEDETLSQAEMTENLAAVVKLQTEANSVNLPDEKTKFNKADLPQKNIILPLFNIEKHRLLANNNNSEEDSKEIIINDDDKKEVLISLNGVLNSIHGNEGVSYLNSPYDTIKQNGSFSLSAPELANNSNKNIPLVTNLQQNMPRENQEHKNKEDESDNLVSPINNESNLAERFDEDNSPLESKQQEIVLDQSNRDDKVIIHDVQQQQQQQHSSNSQATLVESDDLNSEIAENQEIKDKNSRSKHEDEFNLQINTGSVNNDNESGLVNDVNFADQEQIVNDTSNTDEVNRNLVNIATAEVEKAVNAEQNENQSINDKAKVGQGTGLRYEKNGTEENMEEKQTEKKEISKNETEKDESVKEQIELKERNDEAEEESIKENTETTLTRQGTNLVGLDKEQKKGPTNILSEDEYKMPNPIVTQDTETLDTDRNNDKLFDEGNEEKDEPSIHDEVASKEEVLDETEEKLNKNEVESLMTGSIRNQDSSYKKEEDVKSMQFNEETEMQGGIDLPGVKIENENAEEINNNLNTNVLNEDEFLRDSDQTQSDDEILNVDSFETNINEDNKVNEPIDESKNVLGDVENVFHIDGESQEEAEINYLDDKFLSDKKQSSKEEVQSEEIDDENNDWLSEEGILFSDDI